MSEDTKLTAKIMLAIILFVAVLLIFFYKAQATPIEHKEEECNDTLEKPWNLCSEHGINFACKTYCGKMVTMRKGSIWIR